jgi:hypothetical protein
MRPARFERAYSAPVWRRSLSLGAPLVGEYRARLALCWIAFRLEDHGEFALMRMHPDGSHRRVILPLSDFRPRFIDGGTHP